MNLVQRFESVSEWLVTWYQTIRRLEDEDDINQITDYFSYEHFYVIYCKFWELDRDHDLLVSKEDLSRHNDHGISLNRGPRASLRDTWFVSRLPGSLGFCPCLRFDAQCCQFGYSYKASCARPLFLIFDIRALWRSAVSKLPLAS